MNYDAPSTTTKAVDGVQVGTSCYGRPISIVYGTNRVAGNIIWMPHELWVQENGPGAGKGGVPSGSDKVYFQGLIIAICEGPITSIGRVWRDKEGFASLAEAEEKGSAPFTPFLGTRSQDFWPFLDQWTGTAILTEEFTAQPANQNTPPDSMLPYTIINPQFVSVIEVIDLEGGGRDDGTRYQTPLSFQVSGNVVSFEGGWHWVGDDPGGPVWHTIRVNFSTNQNPRNWNIGYGGTAYVASSKLALGNSNTVKNFSFEINGLLGAGDQNPADILSDYLTNTIYGCGLPSGMIEVDNGIDGTQSSGLRQYCTSMSFSLSPVIDDQKAEIEHVKDILESCNSQMLWSEGKLKIIPLGDVIVGDYHPYNTPRYDINADTDIEIGSEEDEAITVTRLSQEKTFNCSPVEYINSEAPPDPKPEGWLENLYNVSVIDDIDQGDVNASGGEIRKSETLSLHCITKKRIAQVISQIRTQRSIYIRNTYKFKLPWRYCLLEPLDLITLTDDVLGLDFVTARIISIEEDSDETLVVEAEEWPFGVAHATEFTTQVGEGGGPSVTVDPAPCNPPVIVTPPLTATADGVTPEIWVGVSGIGKDWGGAQIWTSWDNTTYKLQGEFTAAAHGYLRANLSAGPPTDTSTAQVDTRTSGGILNSTASNNPPELAWLDGELISYTTATLSSGIYQLSGLQRGLLGSYSIPHLAGSLFVRVDKSLCVISYDPKQVGSVVYVKVVGFNLSRTRIGDLATARVYTYPLKGEGTVTPPIASLPFHISFEKFSLSDWDLPVSSPGVLLQQDDGVSTGKVLRCSGGRLWMIHKTLIPYNPSRLYKVAAIFRQAIAGSATRKFTFGLCGIAADKKTPVNATGQALYTDQYICATALTNTSWQEKSVYWKDRVTNPNNPTGGTISAPGRVHSSVRYVRLLAYFNDDPAGDGAQDLDSITIMEGQNDKTDADVASLVLAGTGTVVYFSDSAPSNS